MINEVLATEFEGKNIDLIKLCMDNKIINDIDKFKTENNDDDILEKFKHLLNYILYNNYFAYGQLMEICYNNYKNIYDILKKNVSIYKGNFISLKSKRLKLDTVNITLKEYKEPIITDIKINRSTKIYQHEKLGTYSMQKTNTRGVLFLVNIIDYKGQRRNGAIRDSEYLLHLFQFMGFKIFYYQNITYEEYETLIDQLLHSDFLDNIDCFVLSILAHGRNINNINHIIFIDEIPIDIEEIYSRFNNTNCTALLNKPKIFLFPVCRGRVLDTGVRKIEHDAGKITDNIDKFIKKVDYNPSEGILPISDMIICYGTVHGFISFRSVSDGSWYIKTFYDILCEHAHDTDFLTMLKMIGVKVNSFRIENDICIQTPCYANLGLKKALFFNPGYYGLS